MIEALLHIQLRVLQSPLQWQKTCVDDTAFLAASLKLIFIDGLPHLMSEGNSIKSEAV